MPCHVLPPFTDTIVHVFTVNHRPGGEDPDIYIEEEKPSPAPDNRAYVTRQSPSAGQSRGSNAAAALSSNLPVLLVSSLLLWTLWLNS